MLYSKIIGNFFISLGRIYVDYTRIRWVLWKAVIFVFHFNNVDQLNWKKISFLVSLHQANTPSVFTSMAYISPIILCYNTKFLKFNASDDKPKHMWTNGQRKTQNLPSGYLSIFFGPYGTFSKNRLYAVLWSATFCSVIL